MQSQKRTRKQTSVVKHYTHWLPKRDGRGSVMCQHYISPHGGYTMLRTELPTPPAPPNCGARGGKSCQGAGPHVNMPTCGERRAGQYVGASMPHVSERRTSPRCITPRLEPTSRDRRGQVSQAAPPVLASSLRQIVPVPFMPPWPRRRRRRLWGPCPGGTKRPGGCGCGRHECRPTHGNRG